MTLTQKFVNRNSKGHGVDMSSLIFLSTILNLDFHFILLYTKSDSSPGFYFINTVKIFNQVNGNFRISGLHYRVLLL